MSSVPRVTYSPPLPAWSIKRTWVILTLRASSDLFWALNDDRTAKLQRSVALGAKAYAELSLESGSNVGTR